MLEFFRRYQRYFFLVITVVIIISFSFFGTYSTLGSNPIHEQIAFTAVDGTEVSRAELEEMVIFLGTDKQDKMLFGGLWGPNFFNNGVIKNDILMTGLGAILAEQYANDIKSDLFTRLEKERRYALYVHPQAKFLNVETAWGYFAPDLKDNFDDLRQSDNPINPEALKARIALYLSEKKFPAPLLRQVLRYQEKQYSWLTPDINLDRIDLSLFGYHTVEDWFGPKFIRIVAEFVINSSKIAEQKGYEVSKAETIADLRRNAEISFQENANNPNLGVANSNEYYNEQLRRLGMDQTKAVKVWRQVLLFRRLFHDEGNSVFVDPFTYQMFNAYAKETVEGDVYRLPKEIQMGDYRTLQKFETYLNAVSKRGDDEKSLLTLPTNFLTVDEVAKKYPELVEKRYLLEVAKVDKKNLEPKVGVKETWNWEVEDKNWDVLKKQFPELGIKKGNTRDERFAALDSLDDKTRNRVDTFARATIVDTHPEWIDKALDDAEPQKMAAGLSVKGGKTQFSGLENREELIKLLDQAPIGGESAETSNTAKESAEKLRKFTGDNHIYYRIRVLDKAPEPDVLTFSEANKDGVLDQLLDRQMEAYYAKIRDTDPKEFQNADQTWKPYADVKDKVADRYFAKVQKAIRSNSDKMQAKTPDAMTGDMSASVRLYPYVKGIEDQIQKDPQVAGKFASELKPQEANDKLMPRVPLADQWMLEKVPFRIDRTSEEGSIDKNEAFAMNDGDWSAVHTQPNGDLYFFQLKRKVNGSSLEASIKQINEARSLLSDNAQSMLMRHIIADIKAKHAISLDYLNKAPEMSPTDE